jgi:hypothetical protein
MFFDPIHYFLSLNLNKFTKRPPFLPIWWKSHLSRAPLYWYVAELEIWTKPITRSDLSKGEQVQDVNLIRLIFCSLDNQGLIVQS